MKLKSSLVIALLAVALSAVVAVAAPSADAKKKTGSVSTPAAGTTTAGAPVTGTFNITSFKNVNGVITAVGTFTGTIAGGETVTTPATSVVQAANGTPLAGGAAAPAADRPPPRRGRSRPGRRSGSSRYLFDPRPDTRAAAPRPARARRRPQPGAPADHRGAGLGEPPRQSPLRGRGSP